MPYRILQIALIIFGITLLLDPDLLRNGRNGYFAGIFVAAMCFWGAYRGQEG